MTAHPRNLHRKRILISGGLAVGGPQTHVSILCRVLVEAGAEVTVASASTNWPPEAVSNLRALGVRVVVSPFGFGPLRFLGKIWSFVMWPFFLKRDYEVLYCIGEGKMHLFASRFMADGACKIYHEIVECPRPGSVAAKVAARMDAVIANSRDVASHLTDLLGERAVRTIPFLTSNAPIHAPQRRLHQPDRPLNIVFLGRLVPHKQPEELIEAFATWRTRSPIGPGRLDFYGGDYDGEGMRLRARINSLGLHDSVCLHGAYKTSDLDQIFAATDLVVLPSLYEGLPLVLVEAMQRGVPFVATSAGGTAELGLDNPDVIVTEGIDWNAFETGVVQMAERIRAGQIDAARLHAWAESRYGFSPVAETWRQALLTPELFFASPAAKTHARL